MMALHRALVRSGLVVLPSIFILICLAYLPVGKTRASSERASIQPSSGKPLVNLKNGVTLSYSYAGSTDAVAALENGSATPTAMAAADFDTDGAMDVVAGYATQSGGALAIYRGNPDAYAPKDTTLYQKALKGNIPATFLSRVNTISLPESPDQIVTGDFNRDGYKDVLVAARGGNMYLLAGDGRGNLLAPTLLSLPGQARAMAAAPDGHVAVSFDGSNGSELAILAPTTEGLAISATYPLPESGDSVEWGNLGTGADVAIGTGSKIAIIYGPLGKNPQTETVTVPFKVMGLTLGDFIWDRDNRTEIAALADDGSIQILQHGTLNSAPLTKADLPARAAAIRGKKTAAQKAALKAQIPHPMAMGAWTVAAKLPYTSSALSGALSSSAFSSPHLAASSTHDIMVLDAANSRLSILDTSGKAASPSAAVSFTGAPIAALALPQKINANRDVVVLTSAQSAPTIITADSTDPTYNVNTVADGDAVNACTNSGVTTVPSTLSLREAVCLANNNGAGTYVINLPAGTYSLTSLDGGELLTGTNGSGVNISIVGAGAGSTIIQQTDGVDRILTQDYSLAGNNPLSISALTMQGGFCTDQSDPNAACGDGGGAILGGGEAGSNLTLTNVTMTNNQANPTGGSAGGGQNNGGAIFFEGPTLTITSSTFSSNVASGGGGAILAEQGFTSSEVALSGSISITNSVFADNANVIAGGGANLTLGSGYPGTISGSTFTGNSTTESDGMGGAITTEAGLFTLGNSRIVGNTANEATGVEAESGDSTITNNWWGCNAGPGVPANNGTGSGSGSPGTPNPGCDSIYQDTHDGFTLTYDPWLVLSISANPTQIASTATSTLTADLTHNSNGAGGFSAPDGTPVSFGGMLGSDNPTSTTTTSGQATSTYTAGSSAGSGTGTATVDNQEVSTTIDVLDTVNVTTSPSGLSITVDNVSYTAPQTFNWVVGSAHTIATTSSQAGGAGTQDVFSSWSDGGAISHSIMAPSATTTYTASFNAQYQLTTQSSPSADGSVTPASGGYYASGASIPVTATANAGFAFSGWSSTGGSFDSTSSASTNFHMPASPATVTGNFSLIIVAAGTSTSISSNNNPSFTAAPGNSVTFTATVTSTSTVSEGTVTFSDAASDFTCSGGNTVPVSNGQAACTTSFSTEGGRTITAAYNGTVNFIASSGFLTQNVNNHTVQTGNLFCNQGAITIPSTAGAATPYPSNIFVTGLSGNISAMTVTLNNISSSNIAQTDLLLVGPTGAAIIPFASVGDGSTISDVNVTLDDTASSLIPGGSPLTSGTYKPTSITGSTSLLFPAPAPTVNAGNYAATDGSATLTSTFQNSAPNGTWALYAMDNSGNGAASIGGGWCVNITAASAPTITSGSSTTFAEGVAGTFTVTTTGTPTPSLSETGGLPNGVNFVDNHDGTATISGTATTQHGAFPITLTASNGVGSPAMQSFTLYVTAASPTVTLSTTSINFGTLYLNQVAEQDIWVKNTGPTALRVTDVSVTLGAGTKKGNFHFTSTCDSPIAVGKSCEVTMQFLSANVGTSTATLNIDDNGIGSPQQVSMTGTVIDPIPSFEPTDLTFGKIKVGGSTTKNLIVKNVGSTPLTVYSLAVSGANSLNFAVVSNGCTSALGMNETCTIAVKFTPSATGYRTANLNVNDSAQSKKQIVPLAGTGE